MRSSIIGLAVGLALGMGAVSCASIGVLDGGVLDAGVQGGGARGDAAGARLAAGRTTPLIRQNGSLDALEAELSSVKSERVIVPTQLLRALVRNEKLVHRECEAVAGQLEALKNVDLKEISK